MNSRKVTDEDGRTWACRQDDATPIKEGQDVSILCTTDSVSIPLRLKVSWQWMKIAEKGLARMIAAALATAQRA